MNQDAYFAGFFDADGSIAIPKRSKPDSIHVRFQIRATMSNCDRRVLDIATERYGGKVYWHGRKKNPKHRELFSWIAVSQDALRLLKAVYPYLIVKHRQVQLVFLFQKNVDKYRHLLGSYTWTHPDREKIMAQRQWIADEVSRLKHVDPLLVGDPIGSMDSV